MTEGVKHDDGKARYDLLPPDALDAIAQVFTYGAAKYADRNWEGGMAWGRLFAAMMRHCWAFWRGEDVDPESGLPHLAHAGACVLMLLSHVQRGIGHDNRKPRPGA
jgi:hypothetical protein